MPEYYIRVLLINMFNIEFINNSMTYRHSDCVK